MPRYKLTIEYDGTPFAGWQIQENSNSVQGSLTEALEKFSGERFIPRGAGRTDTGVHALGQVAHIDLEKNWPQDTVRDAINHYLQAEAISVLDCLQVNPDFDARFSATRRHYLYRIISRRAPLTLDLNRVWHVFKPLNVELIREAAESLVGKHDFTTFRSVHCQAKSPVKTLDKLVVKSVGDEIHIHASALSFMHHQVRSMVGSLKHVGEGKWSVQDLADALRARDRSACGTVAPAHGLYFTKVDYD